MILKSCIRPIPTICESKTNRILLKAKRLCNTRKNDVHKKTFVPFAVEKFVRNKP